MPTLCCSCFRPLLHCDGAIYKLLTKLPGVTAGLTKVPLHERCRLDFEDQHPTVATQGRSIRLVANW